MTHAAALPLPARRAYRDELRPIPLWAATALVWAYTASIWMYKTWYLVTAAGVIAVAALIAAGALRTRGFLAAIAPVLAYFLALLAGVLWSQRPGVVLMWTAIDSIEILVFALFFLAARNASPRAVMAGGMSIIIPSIAVAFVMWVREPNLSRLANYALPVMPVAVAMAWAHLDVARRRWPAILTLLLSFALLIVARSRSPLAVAVGISGLSLFYLQRNVWAAIKRVFIGTVLAVVLIGALVAIPATRPMIVNMYVRLTYQSVVWGDLYVPAEAPDQERKNINALAFEQLRKGFPAGIGYLNYQYEFERVHGFPANLHNMFLTWIVEGGLLCGLAVLWLFGAHIRGLLAYLRRARTREERAFGRAIFILTIGVSMMGLLHQIHQTPALWLTFALGAACRMQAREAT